MRYTINVQNETVPALEVRPEAGRVIINGVPLLPFEAQMLGDALNECADQAETLALAAVKASKATYVAKYLAKGA